MSFHNHWTFTGADDPDWGYDAFETKEECIDEGKKWFGGNLLIGQLKDYHIDSYKVVNTEVIV